MNIIFWLLIALIVFLIWLIASFIFPKIGKMIYHTYESVKENVSYEEEDKEIHEEEKKKCKEDTLE